MAFRLYIVPRIGTGAHSDPFRPKYFGDGTIGSPTYAANSYGFEPWMVVGSDLSVADDATIVAEPDVRALPFDLTPVLTVGQANNVKSFLESASIPAGWVTAGVDTWSSVVRGVLGVFAFLQRYQVIYTEQNVGESAPSIFLGGVTLDNTFGQFDPAVQAAMLSTADDQGISTVGLTNTTTMRVILRSVADAYSDRVFDFNGVLV